MTGRKYHLAHCPSCRYFSKRTPNLFNILYTCEFGVKAVELKRSTAIKCKYYKGDKVNGTKSSS